MNAPFRFPRFYVTAPSPCPYLPGRSERKVFTDLSGRHAEALNDALARIGFRRSQGVAYRPSCTDCTACVSVRVLARQFAPNATQRRLLRRYGDLTREVCAARATEEQFDLLQRYLALRHAGGGMLAMDEGDYADMVETSPVNTLIVEYRAPDGRLVGVALTDRQTDGLAMIYSFYDAADPQRPGLGTYIILDHLRLTAEAELPHVYLGYWVRESRRMAYKSRFQPMEQLGPTGWAGLRSTEVAMPPVEPITIR